MDNRQGWPFNGVNREGFRYQDAGRDHHRASPRWGHNSEGLNDSQRYHFRDAALPRNIPAPALPTRSIPWSFQSNPAQYTMGNWGSPERVQSTPGYPITSYGQSQPGDGDQYDAPLQGLRGLSLTERPHYSNQDLGISGESGHSSGRNTYVLASSESAVAEPSMTGLDAYGEPLWGSYKRCKNPSKFFKVGKVFNYLWNDFGDPFQGRGFTQLNDRRSNGSQISKGWTVNSYGEWIFSKPRKFVVVKADNLNVTALPITSYAGQGVAKPSVAKFAHGIIYTGKVPPLPTAEEQPLPGKMGMQPHAIRVDTDVAEYKLDPMSRINFGNPHPIDPRAKVKSFGKVNRASIDHLVYQFRIVMQIDLPRQMDCPRALSPLSATAPVQGKKMVPSDQLQQALRTLMDLGYAQEQAIQVLKGPEALQKLSARRSPAENLNHIRDEEEEEEEEKEESNIEEQFEIEPIE